MKKINGEYKFKKKLRIRGRVITKLITLCYHLYFQEVDNLYFDLFIQLQHFFPFLKFYFFASNLILFFVDNG